MSTVHLQGIGEHKAIPANELRKGMVVVWNYGYKSIVDAIEPSKTGKTLTLTLTSCETKQQHKRRVGADRLVAVDDTHVAVVVGVREGGKDATIITDDEHAASSYEYYVELMRQGEFGRVIWEHSFNNGVTWETVKREDRAA
jgi:hypothetical protein